MFARVADNLRRCIEPHWLGIEQGAGEDIRIAAFDPGRCIDEQSERGRVAFGKAIGAEAFDLFETAFGEIARIMRADHAFDHFGAERVDDADALEGRHSAAQLVGLGRA